MTFKRTIRNLGLCLSLTLLFAFWHPAASQENKSGISSTWMILQAVPSFSWTSFSEQTNFAFEWETTPLIYSFGMNKLDSPFHFLFVTQPERFAGSVEFNISAQLYTSKIGTSHWGFSGQLLAHLPLIEYGEYAGLNLGVARYTIAGSPASFIIGGFSTLFGFLHYNVKYSPPERIWMHSIEFRFF